LLSVLTSSGCTGSHPFADVSPSSYGYGPVGCLYELGITKGISATAYGPGVAVTRVQMAAFLSRLLSVLTSSGCTGSHPFADVSPSSYGYGPVGCLYQLGITNGVSATTYGPGAAVTRAQMAAFLSRTYRFLMSG
ncbi:MAG: S-layer homology domain-containing protein, partial [Acidimicrobiales bacterium]|nr:S-layer homology domain-containing protein [Acidimicrobiales bacterium]